MTFLDKRSDPSSPQASSSGSKEGVGTANVMRVLLVAVGAIVVAAAIVLAVRAPSVSTETETFSGPPGEGAVPVKVERTSARPSDTFLAALLALGGVFVAIGALYPRLQSFEGPGFKVGLAELAPEVKEKLTETAVHEAEAQGTPQKADEIAEKAEKKLIDQLLPAWYQWPQPAQYEAAQGHWPRRLPYETTYAIGRPMIVGPAVTDQDIQAAVSAVASELSDAR